MINDLPSAMTAQSFLYADDATFLNTDLDFQKLIYTMKNTLTEAGMWFRANGFLLNDSKTLQMVFNLRDCPVDAGLF